MKWLYEHFPAEGYNKDEKPYISYGYLANKILFTGESEYQKIDIIENQLYGKTLFLDNLMMTNEKDEFIYHELLVHVPAAKISNPKRALIIGGGDGGIARELCKYDSIEEIIVAEIDKLVIDASRKYLPTIASSFDNPKVKIEVTDGAKFIQQQKDESFDLILIDSTEPIGPGKTLYQDNFYNNCYKKLKKEGQLAAQGLAPLIHVEDQKNMSKSLKRIFPWVKPYIGTIPTYPTSLWLFFHASKKDQDIKDFKNSIPKDLKYINQEMIEACYSLPEFIKKQLA